MFMFLVSIFAIVGAGGAYLLTRNDVTATTSTRVKTILFGAAIGGVFAIAVWASFWLLAVTLRFIFWVVLVLILVLIVWLVARSVKNKA